MKKIAYLLVPLFFLHGCAVISDFERQRRDLDQDIEILKLKIRKERLENELEQLETE